MKSPLPEDTPSQNPFCQPRELSRGLLLWMATCRSVAQREPTFVFPETKLLSFPKKPQEALGSAQGLQAWAAGSLPPWLCSMEKPEGWARPGGKHHASLVLVKRAGMHCLSSDCREL